MSDFDGAAFVRFVGLFADRLHDRREELTELDSAIGDADHGINMDRGFTAVRAKLPELGGSDLGAAAKAVGMTLISTVGGASGPLYGTFFLRLATASGDRTALDAAELGAALRAGLDGVVHRGKATTDDKTMVDAMSPAIEAYEAASGGGVSAGLEAAATAAAAGRDRITPLVARKGRASYLGDRSANHQDPGATSTTILFESLRDAVAAG
ncbi:MAG: phosphoenolpyruvate---glycerone phosphotransferase subunit DhaL [Chloroflexota bacterium]|jgi:dihydroxyacetone kinase-like protein|nr:phosphoenolpyruvate---glycerone phosphotransferase subunit DhaL [Chloroflexota bacterium]